MPSIMDFNLDDIPDQKPVEDGEYQLTITSAKYKESQEKGTPMIAISMNIEDHEDASTVFHNIILPVEDDPKANGKLRMIKQFCDAFSISQDTLKQCIAEEEYEAIVGESGYAILNQEEYQGQVNNRVKRFVTSN